eukprot:jgi/Botrbrau1/1948/Bobra.0005s0040.1
MVSKIWIAFPTAQGRPMVENLRCRSEGGKVLVTFKIKKKVSFGYRVGILGESLGKWSPEKALLLDWGEGDVWASSPVELERTKPLEYKFGILSNGRVVEWQPGPNFLLDWKQTDIPTASALTVEASWEGPLQLVPQEVAGTREPAGGAAKAESQTKEMEQRVEDRDGGSVSAAQPPALEDLPTQVGRDESASSEQESVTPPGSDGHDHPASLVEADKMTLNALPQEGLLEPVGEVSGAPKQAAVPIRRPSKRPTGTRQRSGQASEKSPSSQGDTAPSPASLTSGGAGTRRKPSSQQSSENGAVAGTAISVLAELKVADLKAELKRRGLPISGRKGELVARLEAARKADS